MLDSYSGADLQPGVQTLSGAQALAFARDRHSMLSGDLTRQENGGRLFLAALTQFQKEYAKDPTALLTWLGAGLSNSARSDGLTADQVVQLARPAGCTHCGGTGYHGRTAIYEVLPLTPAIRPVKAISMTAERPISAPPRTDAIGVNDVVTMAASASG